MMYVFSKLSHSLGGIGFFRLRATDTRRFSYDVVCGTNGEVGFMVDSGDS